jgi:hypothetical protein
VEEPGLMYLNIRAGDGFFECGKELSGFVEREEILSISVTIIILLRAQLYGRSLDNI